MFGEWNHRDDELRNMRLFWFDMWNRIEIGWFGFEIRMWEKSKQGEKTCLTQLNSFVHFQIKSWGIF